MHFFQILYKYLEYFFFSFMEVRRIKNLFNVGNVLSMAKNSLNFHFLEPCTLQYGTLFLAYLNVL
jgi:hypothetical protein